MSVKGSNQGRVQVYFCHLTGVVLWGTLPQTPLQQGTWGNAATSSGVRAIYLCLRSLPVTQELVSVTLRSGHVLPVF